MQKLILFFIAVLILFSFSSCCGISKKPQEEAYERNTVYIGSGVYENKEWKTSDFTLGKTIVKGKKDAIRIAQAVYDGQLRHKKLPVFRWSNVAIDDDYVTYNQDKVCWEIRFASYTEKEDGEIVFGGSLIEISISSYDGTILDCDFID